MQGAASVHPVSVGTASPAIVHGVWFVAGLVVSFLVPFVFSDTLELRSDAYYGVYFAIVLGMLAAYVRFTGTNVADLFRRSWKVSLAIGVFSTAFVIWNVLAREDSTSRPDGAYFVWTLGWRGLVYGIVDGLLLTAFPVAVALGIMGRPEKLARRFEFAALAFVLIAAITAAYHLGYEQFREDGVAAPETGNTIISLPALASLNPLGSVVTHAAMHVTADAHAYETEVFLPPQTDAD